MNHNFKYTLTERKDERPRVILELTQGTDGIALRARIDHPAATSIQVLTITEVGNIIFNSVQALESVGLSLKYGDLPEEAPGAR